MSREANLRDAVRRLCQSPLIGGVRRIATDDLAQLGVRENAAVDRSALKRRTEFASGRALLRSLLDTDVEIPRGPGGRAILPAGWIGSLAHDESFAVAVVGPASAVRAIGIDVEPKRELDDGMYEIIVGPQDVVPDALDAFVAKEAVYKAWSSLGGEMLDHHEVRLVVDGRRFTASVGGEWTTTGRLEYVDGRVVAMVIVAAT